MVEILKLVLVEVAISAGKRILEELGDEITGTNTQGDDDE